MDFQLTDEQRHLQATIREFADQEIAPHAETWDRENAFPIEVIRKLGSLGAMALTFPEQYGGLNAGTLAQALVIALSTVKTHTNTIFGKLAVASRTQAIARAHEWHLL